MGHAAESAAESVAAELVARCSLFIVHNSLLLYKRLPFSKPWCGLRLMHRINVESASSVASDQFLVTIPFRAPTAVITSKCVTTSLSCSVPEGLNWFNSVYELVPIAVGNPGLVYGPSTKALLACPMYNCHLPLSLSQIGAGRHAEM